MTLIKYAPANTFDALFRDLTREMWPAWNRVLHDNENDVSEEVRLPRTNIHENDQEYVFTMEMPGLTKKDVEVMVEDDNLVVRGSRTEEKEDGKGLIRREIRSTRFERSFNLVGVDPETIKARMEDGILSVTLPKRPEKVGRRVDVS